MRREMRKSRASPRTVTGKEQSVALEGALEPALGVAHACGIQLDVPGTLERDARGIGGGPGRYGERGEEAYAKGSHAVQYGKETARRQGAAAFPRSHHFGA
jgi:hypothetical protein